MKNEPRIEFIPFFNKQRKAAPLEIKEAFRETLELFLENPEHKALRASIMASATPFCFCTTQKHLSVKIVIISMA
jgi:hypothetical protein